MSVNVEANATPDGSAPATRATPIRTLLTTGAVFGAAYACAGIAFMAFAIFGRSHNTEPAGQLWGNFLMAAYLSAITALPNTMAFVVLVAGSSPWRRLSPTGAATRSAVFGVVAFALTMTGLPYTVLKAIPLLKLVPVMAIWLPYLLPGILLGLLAVLAIWLSAFLSKFDAVKN